MKRDIDELSGNTRIGILELLLVVKGKDHPLPGPLRPPEELEAPSQVDTIVKACKCIINFLMENFHLSVLS